MISGGLYKASYLLKCSGASWRILRRKMSAASSSLTLREQQDGIRRIVLNNPEKRNALSLPMLESLRENLRTDSLSDDLRVIIISGKHSRSSGARGPVFSAGHDLKELTAARGRDYHSRVFQTCSEVRGLLKPAAVMQ
ncbi:hypothetical protein cypCar_00042826 [Cyprinus carpio]|nr:hypothetical protein cypCar_00042826 [Cyprinus carpio]